MKKSEKKWGKKYTDGRKFILRGIRVVENKNGSGKNIKLKLGRNKKILISKYLAGKHLVPVE